jgi:hypothetical protein
MSRGWRESRGLISLASLTPGRRIGRRQGRSATASLGTTCSSSGRATTQRPRPGSPPSSGRSDAARAIQVLRERPRRHAAGTVQRQAARQVPLRRLPGHRCCGQAVDGPAGRVPAHFNRGGGAIFIGSAIETDPSWQLLTDTLGARSTGDRRQSGTSVVADRVRRDQEPAHVLGPHRRWYNFTNVGASRTSTRSSRIRSAAAGRCSTASPAAR